MIAGRITLVSAARVLGLSTRHVRRLLERISAGGAASIRHNAIGRPSNNRISDGTRDYAVTLVRERYADFGPTLAAEKRREAYGELVQIDGPEQRWFEDRGPPYSLLVFVDDATGKLMQLRFVSSESAFTYFEALDLYLKRHGAPVAFYSDKHSVFRVAKKDAKGGQGMTQLGKHFAR